MRVKRLIKRFEFPEQNRSKIVLGTDVRLNPDTARVQLKADSDGNYPTTSDLYFKTWEFNPATVKQWLAFEPVAANKKIDNAVVTSLGYRLSNGTNQYWWNGASWEINTTKWNTVEEVSQRIPVFVVAGRKIQFIVNLKTTDKTVTPEVEVIKLLWASTVEFAEDLIYRTLVPALRENIRPIADYKITKAAASSTIDLDDHPLETPYNIVSIDSVFNVTDDAELLTDLFSSYNAGTKVITLTGSVAKDKLVLIRFVYEPEVAVNTSQDYTELAAVPALVLEDIDFVDRRYTAIADSVVKLHDKTAVKVLPPEQGNLDIQLSWMTDKQIDHMRLGEAIWTYFQEHHLITSKGLDEDYSLWLRTAYDAMFSANAEDLHSGRCRFVIRDVLYYLAGSEDAYAVQHFKLVGDMDVTI